MTHELLHNVALTDRERQLITIALVGKDGLLYRMSSLKCGCQDRQVADEVGVLLAKLNLEERLYERRDEEPRERARKEQVNIMELVGSFTWDFGQQFFIETAQGNFIWSDPDYDGDNTIRPTNDTYTTWMRKGVYGRDKGEHIIGDYCPNAILVKE